MSIEKAPTGISGLDRMTTGGLPLRRATLIYGRPGVGKTILAMQWLTNGTRDGQPGLVVTFEQSRQRLVADMDSLEFGFPAAVDDGAIKIIDFRPAITDPVAVGSFTLEPMLVRIKHAIEQTGATRLVLESVNALFSALGDDTRLRWELTRLLDEMESLGVTTLLVAEESASTMSVDYLADCVIHLSHPVTNRIATRYLRVSKYRGSAHLTDAQPFLISDEGLAVLVADDRLETEASTERTSTGVEELDNLLGGGLYRGSSILVTGAAGTGKSSLGAMLAKATVDAGEKAAYVSFEESRPQVMRNMRSIGVDLGPAVESGRLTFLARRAGEIGLEEHLLQVVREAETHGLSTLVLDPVSNFDAVGSHGEVRSMLARLVDRVKARGITVMMTALTPEQEGVDHDVALSSIVDVWLTVRNLEADGERNRAMYIMKARGIAHSNQIREFVLSDDGIKLIDPYIGPGQVLTGSARVAQERRDEAERRLLEQELERLREELESAGQWDALTADKITERARISELRGRIAQLEFRLEEREEARDAAARTRRGRTTAVKAEVEA